MWRRVRPSEPQVTDEAVQAYNDDIARNNYPPTGPPSSRDDVELVSARESPPSKPTSKDEVTLESRDTQKPKFVDHGGFFDDGVRRIDFVLSFEDTGLKGPDRKRKSYEEQLLNEGLELEYDIPPEDQEEERLAYMKIHVPFDIMCREAEMLQMRAPVYLDTEEDNIHHQDKNGCFLLRCFDLSQKDRDLLPKEHPYITAPFDRARIKHFLIGDDPHNFFTVSQRYRVVWDILQRVPLTENSEVTGKPKRGIDWLLEDEVFTAAYPLHDGPEDIPKGTDPSQFTTRQALIHTWATFGRFFKTQPLDAIRRYFGEQTAFYFAWLGFYTEMLIIPSIIGLSCFIYSVISANTDITVEETCEEENYPGDIILCPTCVPPNCDFEELSHNCNAMWWGVIFDNPTTIIMSVVLNLWVVFFQELWNRKEIELASRWDALGQERLEEDIRPHYAARAQEVHINPITKKEEPYIPPKRRYLWVLVSASALVLLIVAVVGALVALIALKIVLCGVLKGFGGFFDKNKLEIAKMFCDFLTFVVVEMLAFVYEHGAHKLTEYEAPRTESEYLSSFIWKLFIFEMLNNFLPVFYAAFIKGKILRLPSEETYLQELCDPGGCINEVVATISILLLFRLVISNAGEIGIPALKSFLKNRGQEEEANSKAQWHEDFELEEQELDGVYDEYMEMLVQYGYVAFFTPVFPLMPLVALLNNLVEIRVDAINHTKHHRRPLPIRISGLGIWKTCMDIVNKTAVLTNAGIIAFTSDFIPTLVYKKWYSPSGTESGYVAFKLSRFAVEDWHGHAEALMEEGNHTECFYQAYNDPYSPYEENDVWWEIMVFKLMFFSIFTLATFGFQWGISIFIDDAPEEVQIHERRALYLVKKALYDSANNKQEPNNSHSNSRNTQNGSQNQGRFRGSPAGKKGKNGREDYQLEDVA